MTSKAEVICHAEFEYGDALVSLWANGIDADVKALADAYPAIMLKIADSDGCFMLYSNDDGHRLPADRTRLSGWQLVVYVPEDADPDGELDDGTLLFATADPDTDNMLATVIPTFRLVADAIVRGR